MALTDTGGSSNRRFGIPSRCRPADTMGHLVCAEQASSAGNMTVLDAIVLTNQGGTFCEARLARSRPNRGDARQVETGGQRRRAARVHPRWSTDPGLNARSTPRSTSPAVSAPRCRGAWCSSWCTRWRPAAATSLSQIHSFRPVPRSLVNGHGWWLPQRVVASPTKDTAGSTSKPRVHRGTFGRLLGTARRLGLAWVSTHN